MWFGVVCLFRSFEILTGHQRFCLEIWCIRMHPAVIIGGLIVLYAQSWNLWILWLLTLSPTHLGKKKRQQDRVHVWLSWIGWRLMLERVRCERMWCGNMMKYTPMNWWKYLQKAEGLADHDYHCNLIDGWHGQIGARHVMNRRVVM